MNIKKSIAAITILSLLGVASLVHASAYDVLIDQKDISNVLGTATVPIPSGSGHSVLTIDHTTGGLEWARVSHGLDSGGSFIQATGLNIGDVQYLQAELDARATQADFNTLSTVVAGKSDLTHVHSLAQVSGLMPALDGKISTSTLRQKFQSVKVTTDASGNYTWVYPLAYSSTTIPHVMAIAQNPSATIPYNVQIVGAPSATSTVFKVLQSPTTTVLGIVVLGAPAGAQADLQLIAVDTQ